MPRPKLYNTEEERNEAKRIARSQWYYKNREYVLECKKTKRRQQREHDTLLMNERIELAELKDEVLRQVRD